MQKIKYNIYHYIHTQQGRKGTNSDQPQSTDAPRQLNVYYKQKKTRTELDDATKEFLKNQLDLTTKVGFSAPLPPNTGFSLRAKWEIGPKAVRGRRETTQVCIRYCCMGGKGRFEAQVSVCLHYADLSVFKRTHEPYLISVTRPISTKRSGASLLGQIVC